MSQIERQGVTVRSQLQALKLAPLGEETLGRITKEAQKIAGNKTLSDAPPEQFAAAVKKVGNVPTNLATLDKDSSLIVVATPKVSTPGLDGPASLG